MSDRSHGLTPRARIPGMSGARILPTLVRPLEKTGGRYGLATLCVGVGQGLPVGVERI